MLGFLTSSDSVRLILGRFRFNLLVDPEIESSLFLGPRFLGFGDKRVGVGDHDR